VEESHLDLAFFSFGERRGEFCDVVVIIPFSLISIESNPTFFFFAEISLLSMISHSF